jgi:valyl-tRNA synthetase
MSSFDLIELAEGESLVRIVIPEQQSAVVVKDNRVKRVPPPLRHVLGWSVEGAKAWCISRGIKWPA